MEYLNPTTLNNTEIIDNCFKHTLNLSSFPLALTQNTWMY